MRTEQARKMRIAFANVYTMLYRQRVQRGMRIAGIQQKAAEACGVGKGSHGDYEKNKTCRSMSSRFMRDPIVVKELQRLGMVKNNMTGEWYDPELK